MRILNDAEICRLLDVSTEYDYIDYENCETVSTIDIRPALKAQFQQDLKDFMVMLNSMYSKEYILKVLKQLLVSPSGVEEKNELNI